jgi:hypothetical protein
MLRGNWDRSDWPCHRCAVWFEPGEYLLALLSAADRSEWLLACCDTWKSLRLPIVPALQMCDVLRIDRWKSNPLLCAGFYVSRG